MKEITMAKNSNPAGASRFPTMGPLAAPVNASGTASGNTMLVNKRAKGSGMLDAVTANHRKGILEPQGAQGGIKTTLYAPNAAEASLVQRNVRPVPSTIGNRDFWAARASAQA